MLTSCLASLKPKIKKRFTTAKAPQNATINMEELLSPSEEEDEEEEDEWRPVKPEKGRRVSKKPKATGVSSEAPCWPHATTTTASLHKYSCDAASVLNARRASL